MINHLTPISPIPSFSSLPDFKIFLALHSIATLSMFGLDHDKYCFVQCYVFAGWSWQRIALEFNREYHEHVTSVELVVAYNNWDGF